MLNILYILWIFPYSKWGNEENKIIQFILLFKCLQCNATNNFWKVPYIKKTFKEPSSTDSILIFSLTFRTFNAIFRTFSMAFFTSLITIHASITSFYIKTKLLPFVLPSTFALICKQNINIYMYSEGVSIGRNWSIPPPLPQILPEKGEILNLNLFLNLY